jgi:hypothetical protein
MSRSPRKSRRTVRAAAAAGLAALVLGACANQDADRDDVVNAVEEAGGSTEVANCVGNAFEDTFSQEQLNDLANADTPDDFPDDAVDENDNDSPTLAEAANGIMDSCWASDGEDDGLGGDSSEGETTDSSESTESTESTTSTTAAAE